MHKSADVPRDGALPELDQPRARPTLGPAPGRPGDSAELILHLAQDHERIAGGLNDTVVHRLFSVGLTLEMALGLIGDHHGAGKVQEAIGQLDLAIQDLRNILFNPR